MNFTRHMKYLKHKELLMVKDLFLHGKRHAFYESGFDRRLAIVSFHNSIELFIRDALNTKSVSSDVLDKMKFEEKIKCFEERCLKKGEIPFKGKLLDLNELRNKIYHNYEVPTNEKIGKYTLITNEFLSEMMNKIYRINFDDLSFFDVDNIKNPYVKKYYTNAATYLEEGEYRRCGYTLYEAFHEQWNSIYGAPIPNLYQYIDSRDNEIFEEIINAINGLTSCIEENLKMLQLNTVRKEHLHLKNWIESIFSNYIYNSQESIKPDDVDKFKKLLEEFISETDDYVSENYLQIRSKEYDREIKNKKILEQWIR